MPSDKQSENLTSTDYAHRQHRAFDRGFTLLELVIVVVIIAVLGIIIVPKFLDLSELEVNVRCEANRAIITSAVLQTYAIKLQANSGQSQWLETATISDVHDSMFVDKRIPACPTGGTYSLSQGVVSCSVHGK